MSTAAKYPFGVRFWAQHYTAGSPRRFDIYEYVRHDPTTGLHIFVARSNSKVILTKNFYQLTQKDSFFRPFCLVTERIFGDEVTSAAV